MTDCGRHLQSQVVQKVNSWVQTISLLKFKFEKTGFEISACPLANMHVKSINVVQVEMVNNYVGK